MTTVNPNAVAGTTGEPPLTQLSIAAGLAAGSGSASTTWMSTSSVLSQTAVMWVFAAVARDTLRSRLFDPAVPPVQVIRSAGTGLHIGLIVAVMMTSAGGGSFVVT